MSLENFKYNLQRLRKCNQYWDEMNPVAGGRHCAKCSKTIVDFSGMSFTEIALFMSESKEPVCGFYLPEQLKQIKASHSNIPVALGFTTLMATAAFAGEKKSLSHPIENIGQEIKKNSEVHHQSAILNDSIFISGRVQYLDTITNSIKPVEFASVIIKGKNYGTMTDKDGRFHLPWQTTDTSLVIIVSSIGFSSYEQQLSINKTEIDMGPITIEPYRGDITEFYVSVKKRSFFGRLWQKIKRPFRR